MRPTTNSVSLYEILFVVLIFSGWFIYGAVEAALAGFPADRLTNSGALHLVLFECLAFAIVSIVLMARGWTLQDFKFSVTWEGSVVGSILFGITLLVHFGLWDAVVMAGYAQGEVLVDVSASVTFPMAVLFSVVNGAFEEFFLTQYLINALESRGIAFAVGVSALVRLLYHVYQGPFGALSILGFGLVLTLYYVRYRQLWPVMFAHIFADLTALV